MKPTVIINLKTYHYGPSVLKLAKAIEQVDKKIILGAQATDIHVLYSSVKNPIFAQHVDFAKPGRNTGFITPESVMAVGAKGAFLNHSEHRLPLFLIKETIKQCKRAGLQIALFAKNLNQAKEFKKLKPEYLIIEPPELVASKTTSVSKAKPGLISNIAKNLNYPFLVGAGVKDANDLHIAIKRGASGIALSSAVTTAKNPGKVLKNLLDK